jgi:hypothetical protein
MLPQIPLPYISRFREISIQGLSYYLISVRNKQFSSIAATSNCSKALYITSSEEVQKSYATGCELT